MIKFSDTPPLAITGMLVAIEAGNALVIDLRPRHGLQFGVQVGNGRSRKGGGHEIRAGDARVRSCRSATSKQRRVRRRSPVANYSRPLREFIK